MSQIIEDMLIC